MLVFLLENTSVNQTQDQPDQLLVAADSSAQALLLARDRFGKGYEDIAHVPAIPGAIDIV